MNDLKKEGVQSGEFGLTQQQELRTLRMKQIGEKLTEEDRTRLLELAALEETSKKPSALNPEEYAEYLLLTREQTASGKDWTETKKQRVTKLQKRLENHR